MTLKALLNLWILLSLGIILVCLGALLLWPARPTGLLLWLLLLGLGFMSYPLKKRQALKLILDNPMVVGVYPLEEHGKRVEEKANTAVFSGFGFYAGWQVESFGYGGRKLLSCIIFERYLSISYEGKYGEKSLEMTHELRGREEIERLCHRVYEETGVMPTIMA